MQKLTPGFKNHIRNLSNFRKAVESQKSWNLMSFCPKNTFLQRKHYIQRIYLTLLSTTCVKIHQITCVNFEAISHFSRHNLSVSFLLKYYYITSTKVAHQSAKFLTYHAPIKVHQIPHFNFQIKILFFFKVLIFFQCHER